MMRNAPDGLPTRFRFASGDGSGDDLAEMLQGGMKTHVSWNTPWQTRSHARPRSSP